MLKRLDVSNYVLIDQLAIDFNVGFTTMTGETGAGKSILLGAIGLLLGDRADLKSLLDTSKKCIIEGVFEDLNSKTTTYLQNNELEESDDRCIIRREILPEGRSRAFVNDSPVKLDQLQKLTDSLLDIHKQDDVALLSDRDFRLEILDKVAGNESILAEFNNCYTSWKSIKKELEECRDRFSKAEQEKDYLQFQLLELEELGLDREELVQIEEEHSLLVHGQELAEGLSRSIQLMDDGSGGLVNMAQDLESLVQDIARYWDKARTWSERMTSVLIELRDLQEEFEADSTKIELDPSRLEQVEDNLRRINNLLKKHQLHEGVELLDKRDELRAMMLSFSNDGERINELETAFSEATTALKAQTENLSMKRKEVCSTLSEMIQEKLNFLGMPDSIFSIELSDLDQIGERGKDDVRFSFSANLGIKAEELSKVASGGERSRLMLAIKEVYSRYTSMPTMIFDEIDTGVSGFMARKMGELLNDMGQRMQILAITHISQIAALGREQLQISKSAESGVSKTFISRLEHDERIVVIAEMIGGKKDDKTSIENARSLLGLN